MKLDRKKIGTAIEVLVGVQLNDAEQLRLAEKLIENVFTRVCPLTDPQMCIAEGYLASGSHAVEQARQLVESWPHESLPADPDLEPENSRDAEVVPIRRADPRDGFIVRLRICNGEGRALVDIAGNPRAHLRYDDLQDIRARSYVEVSVTRTDGGA